MKQIIKEKHWSISIIIIQNLWTCFWSYFHYPGSPPVQVNAQGGVSVSWAKRGGVFQAPGNPEDKINMKSKMNWFYIILPKKEKLQTIRPDHYCLKYPSMSTSHCFGDFKVVVHLDQSSRIKQNLAWVRTTIDIMLCSKHHVIMLVLGSDIAAQVAAVQDDRQVDGRPGPIHWPGRSKWCWMCRRLSWVV